jgi:hypothetical protein
MALFFYTVYTVQKKDDVLAGDRKWLAGVTTMVQLLVGNTVILNQSTVGFPTAQGMYFKTFAW